MSVIEYVKDIREVIHVDSVNNLHALIVEELRKAGVKIPFGIDLCCMRAPLSHEREIRHFNNYLAHVPCYYLESFGHIPSFLVRASEVIMDNINVEGIFRKSGSLSRQKKLVEDIEQVLDISSANVFDVTGLIKQFFRELKEPLLTNIYHTAFLKCQQIRDSGFIEKGRRAVLKLCLLIPPEHLGTLKFTMNLFSKVAAHSAQNKMTARNLALIMAPSIMHNCPKGNKMSGQEEKWLPLKTSLLEMLIHEHENIGLVSVDLCDQAKEMANFFSKLSPYKYDAIAEGRITPFNNENNSTTTVTKKKHQRRSGSLQDFMSNIANRVTRWRQNGTSISSSSSLSSSEEFLDAVDQQQIVKTEVKEPSTPVILGKRKSSSVITDSGLSASKRKARILGDQPLLPSTPCLEVKAKPATRRSRSLDPTDRLQMSPSKKAKTKPFFQSLYSSKSSKKTEETKSKAGKSVQTRAAAAPPPEDRSRSGKKSSSTTVRPRKRSPSPFQRFLKRRKDDWSVSKIPVKKKISSPQNASVSLVTCSRKNGNNATVVVSPFKEKQSSDYNQLHGYPKTVPIATAEDSDSDSDQSDAGFSTISGGTVIFVPPKQRADLSGETFEKGVKGSINKALSKRDLVLCDHSVKGRSPLESSISLRTRSRSVDNGHDPDSLHLQSRRSHSASETKGTHKPNARASFKVTNETKKILQRAQVPSENLIQPGIISSTPNASSVDKSRSVRRASSANETLQQSNVKVHSVRRTSSMAVHKQNSSLPVLKSNMLKTRMMLQNQQENMNARPSPSWCRPVNEDSPLKPLLKRNVSDADNICKTPKCTRLRRISNPLPASPTPSTPVSSRRQTEYKQMIKACLNSPNLHKNVFPPETKVPESELAKINFDYLANQQDMLLHQLKSIERSFKEFPVPKPPKVEIDLEELPESYYQGKENNSVFLSPAPIVKYRRERLPMASIDTEDCDEETLETGNKLNERPHPLQDNTQPRPRVITSEEEVPIIYVQKDPKPLPQIQSIGVFYKYPKRVTPHILSYYKYARFNV